MCVASGKKPTQQSEAYQRQIKEAALLSGFRLMTNWILRYCLPLYKRGIKGDLY